MSDSFLNKIPAHKRADIQLAREVQDNQLDNGSEQDNLAKPAEETQNSTLDTHEQIDNVASNHAPVETTSSLDDEVKAWRGRYEKLEKESKPIAENHAFIQGKLLEEQAKRKELEAEAAKSKELAARIAELEAEKIKASPLWDKEKRERWSAWLSEEAAAELEAELADISKKSTELALLEANKRFESLDKKYQTREEFDGMLKKQNEIKFLDTVPKKFYTLTSDPKFIEWAANTKDGRRSIKQELAQIVNDKDLDGIEYINKKIEQYEKNGTPKKPNASVAPRSASSNNDSLGTGAQENFDNFNFKAAIRNKNPAVAKKLLGI